MDDLVKTDMVNLNFKGIEMREPNEGSGSLSYLFNYERLELVTSKGINMTVFSRKGKSAKDLAIMTFHDIGCSYKSFCSFFNYPEMRVITENFTTYHVCAPGHVPDYDIKDESRRLLPFSESAGDISEDKSSVFTISGNPTHRRYSSVANLAYPTMDELASLLEEVMQQLKLKSVVAFGMGAGSNVLSRLAIQQHKHGIVNSPLLGMILLNPNDTVATYWDWGKLRWSDLPRLRSTGQITDALQDWLVSHWTGLPGSNFSEDGMADIEEEYLQAIRRGEINCQAAAGYMDSYLCRTALGLSRDYSVQQQPSGGSAMGRLDVMLITGDRATYMARAMADMNGNMDPARTQFLSMMDSSGMVMEESPSKLAVVFMNFLRNLGIMITMTPDKLTKLATMNQIETARQMFDVSAGSIATTDNKQQSMSQLGNVDNINYRGLSMATDVC